MTAYDNLKRKNERNVYTRGMNKGDAPLDKRSARHKRILAPTDRWVRVQMHKTYILEARPDGTVTLDSGGWDSSPTTREAMAQALQAAGIPGWFFSERRGGYSQTALRVSKQGATYRFYDGMVLDSEGKLLSVPKPWTRRVADREARAAKREELKPLLDVLPLLHAGIKDAGWANAPRPPYKIALYSPDMPEKWPNIVANYTLTTTWRQGYVQDVADDWRVVRARILADATKDMTRLEDI